MSTPPKYLDKYADSRRRMLEDHLKGRGISSENVLAAMEKVPRERFVPESRQPWAYADNALPIDCDQTISQPYIVGLMTEALELTGKEKVLEIGTGSGYQTAVLAEIAKQVFTVDRHEPLLNHAHKVLDDLGYTNIEYHLFDGAVGWEEKGPFDRIIVTAALPRCYEEYIAQLKVGGLLVAPLGGKEIQTLQYIRKLSKKQTQATPMVGCRFVPYVNAKA